MRKLRAALWFTAAALLVVIVVLPAIARYQSTTAATASQPVAVPIADIDEPAATQPASTRLSLDTLDRVVPMPKGAQRNVMSMAAAGSSVFLYVSRRQRQRRAALRSATPLMYMRPQPLYAGPIVWTRDLLMMESIGEVGLLQPIALPILRQQAHIRELAMAA